MGSLQELLTSLDASHAALKDKIAEVNLILEFSSSFQHGRDDQNVVNTGDHVPTPVLKWSLRWLLRHLEEVANESASELLQPLYWDLFGDVLQSLSPNDIANGLRGHPVLKWMTQAISQDAESSALDTISHHRQSSSDTLIGTDAPNSSPSVFANPLKRKRETEKPRGSARKPQIPHGFPAPCKGQAPGFVSVSRCLSIIQKKIEGSPRTLTDYGQGSLLMAISADPVSKASLLANAIRNLRATVATRTKEGTSLDFRNELDKLFQPYQFAWDSEPPNEDDANGEIAKQFCSLCLKDALAFLSEVGHGIQSATVEFLQRIIFDLAVSPAKSSISGNRDLNLASTISILNEQFLTILQSAETPTPSSLPNNPSARRLSETILFGIASTYVKEAKPKVASEDKWLSTLFQYLGGIMPNADLQVSNEHRERHVVVQEQILGVCVLKSVRIDRSLLENIISLTLLKYRDQELDLSAWTIIGHCIALDNAILLGPPGSGERGRSPGVTVDISKTTKTLLKHVVPISQPYLSFAGDQLRHNETHQSDPLKLTIAHHVITNLILPLLRTCVRVRRFSQFIACWYRELGKARMHLLSQAASERMGVHDAASVWEDTKVVSAAVAAVHDASIQTPSLWDEAEPEIGSERDDVEHEAKLHSSYVVLSAIIHGLKSEAHIVGIEPRADVVKIEIEKALDKRSVSDTKSWVLWAVASKLLDRWPGIFRQADNLGTIALAIVAKALKKGFKNQQRNTLTLHAAAFAWRLLCISPGIEIPELATNIGDLVCSSVVATRSAETQSNELYEASTMADSLIGLILHQPGPITRMDLRVRENLLSEMFCYASQIQISSLTGSTRQENTPQRSETSINEVYLRDLISLHGLQNHKEIYDDVKKTLLDVLGSFYSKYDPTNSVELSHKDIGEARLLLFALANRNFQDWTAKQQRSLLEGSVRLTYVVESFGHFELAGLGMLALKRMLTPRKGQSLARLNLQAAQDELDLIDSMEQKMGPELVRGIQRDIFNAVKQMVLAARSAKAQEQLAIEDVKAKIPYSMPRLGPNPTKDDARRALRAMKFAFEEASPMDREDMIRQWLRNFEKNPSETNLVFARQLCAGKQTQEERTIGVREVFQELISRLFAIIYTSHSTKEILLAQKAIAVAFRNNSWVLSQAHIDFAFASAASIALMRGGSDEESKDTPSSGEATEEPPKARTRLDLASAQRLVFGSLGLRTPKSKEEGAKLRAKLDARRLPGSLAPTEVPDAEPETDEEASKNAPAPIDPRVPPALYAALCETVSGVLLHHRTRIGGRWHLVVAALRALLACLFEPYHSSTTPAWITGDALNAAHATAFARLLTLLCEPSASAAASLSASRKQHRSAGDGHPPVQLHDDVKRAKELAGQHLPLLLKAYCAASLRGQLASDKKAALMPALYALLGAVGRSGTEVLNEALSKLEREIFRALWDEYLKFGKWQGK